MLIATDISEKRDRAIVGLKLSPVRDEKTTRVLYYLAGRADQLEAHGPAFDVEAGIAAEIFEEAIEAVKRGWLE
jgi:hypothetical protein